MARAKAQCDSCGKHRPEMGIVVLAYQRGARKTQKILYHAPRIALCHACARDMADGPGELSQALLFVLNRMAAVHREDSD